MNARLFLMLLFTVVFVLFAICVQSGTLTPFSPNKQSSYPFGESFTLAEGEIALVERGRLLIVLEAFLEDSRCPANAECVWAGQIKVQANVDGEQYVLTLGILQQSDQSAVDLGDGITLELLGVEPYPGTEADVEGTETTATLIVWKS